MFADKECEFVSPLLLSVSVCLLSSVVGPPSSLTLDTLTTFFFSSTFISLVHFVGVFPEESSSHVNPFFTFPQTWEEDK